MSTLVRLVAGAPPMNTTGTNRSEYEQAFHARAAAHTEAAQISRDLAKLQRAYDAYKRRWAHRDDAQLVLGETPEGA